jgi:TonB family protein
MAEDSEADLFKRFWAMVDKGNARELRKLVHKDSRSRNLNIYLEQYIGMMGAIRQRYPDAAAYKFSALDASEVEGFDSTIPALFKDDQLDVYPLAIPAFLQLLLELDGSYAEIDTLPIALDDGDWRLVFPVESISWPGLERRLTARIEQHRENLPLSAVDPLPIHVELPAFPGEMARAEQSGCARIQFQLDSDGHPDDLQALQSEPSGLAGRDARSALRKWRFAAIGEAISSELLFVFLANPASVEDLQTWAESCGGRFEEAFVITPAGADGFSRPLEFERSSQTDSRY